MPYWLQDQEKGLTEKVTGKTYNRGGQRGVLFHTICHLCVETYVSFTYLMGDVPEPPS